MKLIVASNRWNSKHSCVAAIMFFVLGFGGQTELLSAALVQTLTCQINSVPVPCPTTKGIANVSASTTVSISGFNTSKVVVSVEADAGAQDPSPDLFSAAATIFLDLPSFTAGPIRSGLASYFLTAQGDNTNGFTNSSGVQLGILDTCQQSLRGPTCFRPGILVPFTLGVPFNLGLQAQAAGSFRFSGSANSMGTSNLSLQLFEANGTTPVNIQLVPEPSQFGPMAAVMAGALFVGWRRQVKAIVEG